MTRRVGWLQEVLDDARRRSDAIPEWRKGDDVMREIRKLRQVRSVDAERQVNDDDDATG